MKEGYVPLNHLKKVPKNAEGNLMKTIIDDAKKEESTKTEKCKYNAILEQRVKQNGTHAFKAKITISKNIFIYL